MWDAVLAGWRGLLDRVANAEDGLHMLERLADAADDVALLAADLRLPGMGGLEFLDRAHSLHPGASRAPCWLP